MSPIQCRGARALLNWTVDKLSAESQVSRATIFRFEGGQDTLTSNLKKMQTALEGAGIQFIDDLDGEGVKLTKP